MNWIILLLFTQINRNKYLNKYILEIEFFWIISFKISSSTYCPLSYSISTFSSHITSNHLLRTFLSVSSLLVSLNWVFRVLFAFSHSHSTFKSFFIQRQRHYLFRLHPILLQTWCAPTHATRPILPPYTVVQPSILPDKLNDHCVPYRLVHHQLP